MNEEDELPLNSIDLITMLEKRFSERCIRRGMTLEDAYFEAGARSVVEFLIDLRDGPNQGE